MSDGFDNLRADPEWMELQVLALRALVITTRRRLNTAVAENRRLRAEVAALTASVEGFRQWMAARGAKT